MKWIVGVLLSVLLLFLANSVFTKSSSSVPQSDRERMIAHGSLDPVANEMEDYPDVRDAAIAHHGRKATLVLVVDQKTDGVRAEELGNRFIERIESHVETSFPLDADGGDTFFDYLIVISNARSEVILRGKKERTASQAIWRHYPSIS